MCIIFKIDFIENFFSLSFNSKKFYIFHSVNTIRPQVFHIIVISQKVIVSVIDKKGIRADLIPAAIPPLYLLIQIANGIFQIFKTDLFGNLFILFTHCSIYFFDIIQNTRVIRFYSFCQNGVQ